MIFRKRRRQDITYQPPYRDEEAWHLPHLGIVMQDLDFDLMTADMGENVQISPEDAEMLQRRIVERANREAWERLREGVRPKKKS